ncbi:class I adenylate-forming enzyme family protein [Erythrobacter aurantius]|uniref:class I adenylate-forming enzyme family protein n=1 Tax=Erythrobacter aurantius TaxID=2909249 RepID=UPI0020796D29|nr:AMP-binding protein [Erythrobacter aurantius]
MADPVPPDTLPTLEAHVRWWAAHDGAREAAVLGGTRWSYATLEREVTSLACAMLAAGVARGDRVATLAPPGLDFLKSYLAATRIGAIWVGLNPRYRFDELAHVLRDAAPRLLLARAHPELAEVRALCPLTVMLDDPADLDAFIAKGAALPAGALDSAMACVTAEDPAVLVYTSGSTGAPKGAILSHGAIVRFARGQNDIWPLSPLRVLNYFPINHVGCLNDILAPALVAGGCCVFMEQYDTRESLRLMQDEAITFWGSVPSVFQMQLALPDFADFDLSAVQLIVWEGAAMAPDLIAQLGRICRWRTTNYGMTETTSAITVLEPTDDETLLSETVGSAFPGVEVRLMGADGAPTRPGEAGEVQTRSALNCLGYWNNPEATAAAFTPDGWFRTGDLAMQRPDGRYRIVGRLKEMFKSGGYNVYPREIESVIEAHPDVSAAAVVGIPDPVWDEVGVAYVEGAVTAEAIAEWCRARLANYKIPKHIHCEAALPLLPIGKIDKPLLRRRALAEHALHPAQGDA